MQAHRAHSRNYVLVCLINARPQAAATSDLPCLSTAFSDDQQHTPHP
jgi:hypothetical protein